MHREEERRDLGVKFGLEPDRDTWYISGVIPISYKILWLGGGMVLGKGATRGGAKGLVPPSLLRTGG